ncbi:hypothetical protein Tco_0779898 [Tanacetum coccineum]
MARFWDCKHLYESGFFPGTPNLLAMMTVTCWLPSKNAYSFEVGRGKVPEPDLESSSIEENFFVSPTLKVTDWSSMSLKTKSGIRLMLAPRSARAKHSSNSGKSHGLDVFGTFRLGSTVPLSTSVSLPTTGEVNLRSLYEDTASSGVIAFNSPFGLAWSC